MKRLFGAVAIASLIVFLLAVVAIASNFRDANGFTDCDDFCSTWQDVVGFAAFWSLIVFAVALVAFLVMVALRAAKNRSRRTA